MKGHDRAFAYPRGVGAANIDFGAATGEMQNGVHVPGRERSLDERRKARKRHRPIDHDGINLDAVAGGVAGEIAGAILAGKIEDSALTAVKDANEACEVLRVAIGGGHGRKGYRARTLGGGAADSGDREPR